MLGDAAVCESLGEQLVKKSAEETERIANGIREPMCIVTSTVLVCVVFDDVRQPSSRLF